MAALPYIGPDKNQNYKLLITRPKERLASVTNAGLFLPAEVGDDHEEAIVVETCAGSTIKEGDTVTYRKFERVKGNSETVTLFHVEHDIIPEMEIWSVNDEPFNRVFIEPMADSTINDSGLLIPGDVDGLPQKGVVRKAPKDFFCTVGDIVEYRKNTKKIYHEATIDDVTYDVLFEDDIFTVNDKVTPNRIIVKIDLLAQYAKRQQTDSGLLKSPLFLAMKHNLQYAIVEQIGEKAKKEKQGLCVGQMVVIHHSIESQPHRYLRTERSKVGTPIFEYRIIDNFTSKAREIFGKFYNDGKNIFAFDDNVFVKWDIEVWGKEPSESDGISSISIYNAKDIDELRRMILEKTKEYADYYKAKMSSLKADMSFYQSNPALYESKLLDLRNQVGRARYQAQRSANQVKKDFLVVVTSINGEKILTPYLHLYPIEVMGKKYVIANKNYIIATMESLSWIPIGDRVMVLPEHETDSQLFIPEGVKEVPQKGIAVTVGKDVDPEEIQPGYEVLFRKGAGIEIEINGATYLCMKRNDIFNSKKPSYS